VEGVDVDLPLCAAWKTLGVTVAGREDTLNEPVGLYATKDGTLYVVDRRNHRVMKYTSNGGGNGTQISDGKGNGSRHLNSPTAVVVDEATNAVYISDYGNSRIQLWSEGGLGPNVETVLGILTSNDTDTSAFPQADDIQLDPGSNHTLYILDAQNARLSRWRFWAKNSESSVEVYRGAMGVHVDGQRNLYVADCYRHEISKWVNGRHVGGTAPYHFVPRRFVPFTSSHSFRPKFILSHDQFVPYSSCFI
jgi:hypothetical protein